ncbi:hypothetical protein M0812_02063 [Anaeramoeba flamelloides]|uniref:Uncharacterized protein n=1 Tax=Anaeramoeba flamelloides TaxID=1746091 RepID=A0AAV7Z1Y6_9EUKA|nr:hypothetical protein M0812_02063 [Anaeramoeba flamelloides]
MTNHNNSQSIPEETEDHHLFDLEPPIDGQVTEQTQNLKSNTKNIPKKIQKITGDFETRIGTNQNSQKDQEPIRSTQSNQIYIPKPNRKDSKISQKNNFLTNKQNSQETFPEKQTIEDKSLDTTYNDSTNISSQSKKTKQRNPLNEIKAFPNLQSGETQMRDNQSNNLHSLGSTVLNHIAEEKESLEDDFFLQNCKLKLDLDEKEEIIKLKNELLRYGFLFKKEEDKLSSFIDLLVDLEYLPKGNEDFPIKKMTKNFYLINRVIMDEYIYKQKKFFSLDPPKKKIDLKSQKKISISDPRTKKFFHSQKFAKSSSFSSSKSDSSSQSSYNLSTSNSPEDALYITNISSSEESNTEKKKVKKNSKIKKNNNNKKKNNKKKKSNSKNKSKRAIIQIKPKDNCPFCLKPKDGPQHPFDCDYLKDLIHTKIQKRKFKNCLVRLRISSCKQGKDFINIFIENSKCHENKIINIYLNNGKEMNNSNTRVGVQGRQNRYDNLRTMMNNNQNNLNLRKNLNPNNPESMFYSDEETKN